MDFLASFNDNSLNDFTVFSVCFYILFSRIAIMKYMLEKRFHLIYIKMIGRKGGRGQGYIYIYILKETGPW